MERSAPGRARGCGPRQAVLHGQDFLDRRRQVGDGSALRAALAGQVAGADLLPVRQTFQRGVCGEVCAERALGGSDTRLSVRLRLWSQGADGLLFRGPDPAFQIPLTLAGFVALGIGGAGLEGGHPGQIRGCAVPAVVYYNVGS